MNNISKIIISGAFAILSTTAAFAQSTEPRTITVEHADLDLNSEAGQKTLKLRIDRAASAVCSSVDAHQGLAAKRINHKCRNEAVAKAMESVNGKATTQIAAANPSN